MDIIFSTVMLLYSLLTGSGEDHAAARELAASVLNASLGTNIVQASPTGGEGQGTSETGAKRDPQKDAPVVKGIYVTAHSAGGARMDSLLKLVDDTKLNSMVIDVKDDNGYITYPTETPELLELGTTQKYIRDIGDLMKKLKQHEVYPIARIVVFMTLCWHASIRAVVPPFRRNDLEKWPR